MELIDPCLLFLVIVNLSLIPSKIEATKVAVAICRETENLKSELVEMRRLLRCGNEQFKAADKFFSDWTADIPRIVDEVDDLVDDIGFYLVRFHSPPDIGMSGLTGPIVRISRSWDRALKGFGIVRNIQGLIQRTQLVNDQLQDYRIDTNLHRDHDDCCKSAQEEEFLSPEKLAADYPRQSAIGEDCFVGKEDDEEAVLDRLTSTETARLDVIAICGMAGVGKTALLRRVLQHNCLVKRQFDMIAYVYVGPSHMSGRVLKGLALQLCSWEGREEEMMSLSDLETARKIFELLETKKYLIALDDVWSTDAWECLALAFPTGEMGSRVLIATRNAQVAEKIATRDGLGFVHQMRPLTQDEGLELLLTMTVSKGPKLDPDVLNIARDIVSPCGGSPLAIQLVGGILAAKPTLDEHGWRTVKRDLDSRSQLMEQGPEDIAGIRSILVFAYDALPFYLKPCFLYLSIFPEDAEIEAERLYLLWMAEGLIPSPGGGSKLSMMDVAERFLNELWIRNMVVVQKAEFSLPRLFKSFHIDGLIRDLCLSKSKEGNFGDAVYFRRAKHMDPGSYSPFTRNTLQRLALYFEDGCVVPSHWNNDKHRGSLLRLRVLSLCGLNFEMLKLPRTEALFPQRQPSVSLRRLRRLPLILSDLSGLKRLRTLVLCGFNFYVTNFPAGIEKLFRLRHLSLRGCNIARLPSSICCLLNLVTLDLEECNGNKMVIVIPNELQKLQNLRHLYLPPKFQVHETDKLHLGGLKQLEILVNFDSRPCRAKDLPQLTKLRTLVLNVDWNFEELELITHCLTEACTFLHYASILVRNFGCNSKEQKRSVTCKLLGCKKLQRLHVEGPIGELPRTISPSLTEINLSGCELKDDPIEILEKLPWLSMLGLHNNGFLGKKMTCSDLGMPRLRCLTLSDLPNLENLTVRKGGMAKLSTLAIKRCLSLVELPEGLSFLSSLRQLNVAGMPPAFMDKLQKMGEGLHKVTHLPII